MADHQGQGPVFTKISQLNPDDAENGTGFNIIVKVIDTMLVKPQRLGTQQHQLLHWASCWIADETGNIIFIARPKQVKLMKVGTTVILHNAKINILNRSIMRLEVYKSGHIEVTDCGHRQFQIVLNPSDKHNQWYGRRQQLKIALKALAQHASKENQSNQCQGKKFKMTKDKPLTKIALIDPHGKRRMGHNLKVKVIDIMRVKEPCDYETEECHCWIGDETGKVILIARPQQVELMKEGDIVILYNAKVKIFNGSMRLKVDETGEIEVTKEPVDFYVRHDWNYSLLVR